MKELIFREFLNKPGHHSTASIIGSVNKYSFDLEITDCSRKITLSNNVSKKSCLANGIHKLETLKKGVDFILDILKKRELFDLQPSKNLKFETRNEAIDVLFDNNFIKTKNPYTNTDIDTVYDKNKTDIAILYYKKRNKKFKYILHIYDEQ